MQFPLRDALGTVRASAGFGSGLTQGEASINDYRYSAFGLPLWENFAPADASTRGSLTSQSAPSPWAFTGQRIDPATGLQYHRARWLDTSLGRWASVDPVWDFRGNFASSFGYCRQSPAFSRDASGRFSIIETFVTGQIASILRSINAAEGQGALNDAYGLFADAHTMLASVLTALAWIEGIGLAIGIVSLAGLGLLAIKGITLLARLAASKGARMTLGGLKRWFSNAFPRGFRINGQEVPAPIAPQMGIALRQSRILVNNLDAPMGPAGTPLVTFEGTMFRGVAERHVNRLDSDGNLVEGTFDWEIPGHGRFETDSGFDGDGGAIYFADSETTTVLESARGGNFVGPHGVDSAGHSHYMYAVKVRANRVLDLTDKSTFEALDAVRFYVDGPSDDLYKHSREFATQMYEEYGVDAILYPSFRHPNGTNIAILDKTSATVTRYPVERAGFDANLFQ